MSSRPTNLLNLLASIPPEHLVEGTRIDVTTVDGEAFTITLGERRPAFCWCESAPCGEDPCPTRARWLDVEDSELDPPPAGLADRALERIDQETHCHADGHGPCLAGDCPIAGMGPLRGHLRPCPGAPGPQHPAEWIDQEGGR